MQPFAVAQYDESQVEETLRLLRAQGVPESVLDRLRREMLEETTVVKNDLYQVAVRPVSTDLGLLFHLSIKRLDREVIHDWRELQEIKNLVLGPEMEAVELYPAESRLVDTSNQYHLWALPGNQRWPFGFLKRAVTGEGLEYHVPRAKQRPR